MQWPCPSPRPQKLWSALFYNYICGPSLLWVINSLPLLFRSAGTNVSPCCWPWLVSLHLIHTSATVPSLTNPFAWVTSFPPPPRAGNTWPKSPGLLHRLPRAMGPCAYSLPTKHPCWAQAGHAWGQQFPPTVLWLLLCCELVSQAAVSQGEVRTLVATSDGENQLGRSPEPRLLLSQCVKPVFSKGLYEANIHSTQPPALLVTTFTQLSALRKLAVIF